MELQDVGRKEDWVEAANVFREPLDVKLDQKLHQARRPEFASWEINWAGHGDIDYGSWLARRQKRLSVVFPSLRRWQLERRLSAKIDTGSQRGRLSL